MRLNYLICVLMLAIPVPAFAQAPADALAAGDIAAPAPLPFPSATMPDVRVRTVNWQEAGSLYSEATGTKLRAGTYYIFYDRNPRFDWDGLDTQSMKPGETIYCEIPISAALGQGLEGVWNGMLGQARPQPSPASGGATIFVTSMTQAKPVTAVLKTFAGPKTKDFYAVVDAMGQACIAKDAASLAALSGKVDALAAQLK